jgi:HlyD family secretion protein
MKNILKKWKRYAFLILFLGFFGFSKLYPFLSKYFPTASVNTKIPKVNTFVVHSEEDNKFIPIYGILEPSEMEEIPPKYSGVIEKFYVDEGDTVKKGDALFKMSTSILKAEVEKQRFASKIAEAQVRIQREKIKKVKKNFLTKVLEYKKFKNIETRSILENDRTVSLLALKTELFKEGIISAEDLKSVNFEKKNKEIQKNNSEIDSEIASIPLSNSYYQNSEFLHKLSSAFKESSLTEESELTASESNLRLANQQLSMMEEQLRSSIITSPIDGRVLKKRKNQGEYIPINSNSIITIGVVHNLKAVFTLGELDSFKIKKGFKISIQTDVIENRDWMGKVLNINPLFEEKIFSSKIKAEIENLDLVLHPGIYFKGKIYLDQSESSVYIPENALYSGEYVFIYENNTVKKRKIQYTLATDNRLKIISGLSEKEEIVIQGKEDIQDGMKVIRDL